MNNHLIILFFLIVSCKVKTKPVVIVKPKIDTVKIDNRPVLVLDAGHGAVDPGAVNDSLKLYEKNVTRKIVDAVLKTIDTNKIRVIQTRPLDSNIHRHQRIKLANLYNPNLLLTVHINNEKDTSYNGFEIGYADSLITFMDDKDTLSISNPNKVKAEIVASTLSKKIGAAFPLMRNRFVKKRKDRIWMIVAGKYPSVLIEFGFINSRKDLVYLTDSKAINKLASAITASVYKELLPNENPKIN